MGATLAAQTLCRRLRPTRLSLARAGLAAVAFSAVGAVALMHPRSSRADSLPCQAPNRGFDFDTYELENYQQQYAQAIELAAAGKAAIPAYTLSSTGETVDFTYPGLESGPRAARLAANPALRIPPSIFKAIIWIESLWSNGSASVPYGGVGPLLVSGDCGYGLAQITSGMGQFGSDAYEPGVPSARQALIGTDFLFNLAEGARILASKWNQAPQTRPIAGNGNPAMLEDWYYAIWSYNGFALSNHPLNPNLDPLRGGGLNGGAEPVFHCNDPNAPGYQALAGGGLKYVQGDYTYPERVYGCMRYPPLTGPAPTPTPPAPTPTATASPGAGTFKVGDTVVVTGTGDCLVLHSAPGVASTRINATPDCAPDGTSFPIIGGPQTVTTDSHTWWQVQSAGGPAWVAGDFLAAAGTAPPVLPPVTGPRLWQPVVFAMPNLTDPSVAAAFQPANFQACQDNQNFAGGCPAMDFPTSFPNYTPPVSPNPDPTPAVNPGLLAGFLGNPILQVTGPATLTLAPNADGSRQSGTVTVHNAGTFIAPFRIRTSAAWLTVRHPNDPAARSMVGGVAIGGETEVVTQSGNSSGRQRIAQAGYDSVLMITVDPSIMPAGTSTGTVVIEPLLGSGSPFTVTVTASAPAAGATAAPTFYRFIPGLASDAP